MAQPRIVHTHPPHMPVDGRSYRLTVGLRRVAERHWLEVDHLREAEMALKAELLATAHSNVIAFLPDAATRLASAALHEMLVAQLQTHHDGVGGSEWARDGVLVEVRDASLHPIDQAGRLVQEDLAIMAPEGERGYVLAAASICFPSRWSLVDKIGRDMPAIHQPVPQYAERIGVATDLAISRIGRSTDGAIWERQNWTLLDDYSLYQPGSLGRGKRSTSVLLEQIGQDVFFRVERQTLRRITGVGMPAADSPEPAPVVFTIRTHVAALTGLSPGQRADLRATLATVPESTIEYKGWRAILEPMRQWLAATD